MNMTINAKPGKSFEDRLTGKETDAVYVKNAVTADDFIGACASCPDAGTTVTVTPVPVDVTVKECDRSFTVK